MLPARLCLSVLARFLGLGCVAVAALLPSAHASLPPPASATRTHAARSVEPTPSPEDQRSVGFIALGASAGLGVIGVNLNYDAATDSALPLRDPPRCFTILISAGATYPGEFRAEPLGKVPPGGQPLFWYLHPGVNDVCLDRVQVSTHCSAEWSCLGPESLTDGVATLNITAASAAFQGGPIDFCVEAIIPHD